MTISNGYVTNAELAAEIGNTAAAASARIDLAVEAASRAIDEWCGQRFWQDSVVQAKTYRARDLCELTVDPISTTTGLVVKTDDNDDGVYETTWTVDTDFIVEPVNRDAGEPWTCLRAVGSKLFPTYVLHPYGVQVTAKFGWVAVPAPVKLACLVMARDFYDRKNNPFAIVTTDVGIARIRDDATLRSMLAPYKRSWGIG